MVRRFSLVLDGESYQVEWEKNAVLVNGQVFKVQFPDEGVVLVDGQRHTVEVRDGEAVVDGMVHTVQVDGLKAEAEEAVLSSDAGGAGPTPAGADAVTAIMPGKIVQVLVSEGQVVSPDQVVCVLEAMKMQNELRAAKGGKVAEVRVRPGQDVEIGQVLVVLSE